MNKKDIKKNVVPYVLLFALMGIIIYIFYISKTSIHEFTYNEFMNKVSEGEIKEIEHKGTENITGKRELEVKPGDYLKKFHINFKDDFDRISQI